MRLAGAPQDAVIYVDDRFRGRASENGSLVLSEGRHRIEVVHPRFEPVRHEVTVARGETRYLTVRQVAAAENVPSGTGQPR